MSLDPFNLQRFVDAQADVYEEVQIELARGRKTTHWMWFVFPQLRALGHSVTAHYYGIASRDEASPICSIASWGRGCANAWTSSWIWS